MLAVLQSRTTENIDIHSYTQTAIPFLSRIYHNSAHRNSAYRSEQIRYLLSGSEKYWPVSSLAGSLLPHTKKQETLLSSFYVIRGKKMSQSVRSYVCFLHKYVEFCLWSFSIYHFDFDVIFNYKVFTRSVGMGCPSMSPYHA